MLSLLLHVLLQLDVLLQPDVLLMSSSTRGFVLTFGFVWLGLACSLVFGLCRVWRVIRLKGLVADRSQDGGVAGITPDPRKIIGTNSGRFVHAVKQRHCGGDNVLADDEKPHSLSFDSRIGHTISNHSDDMVTLQGLNVYPFRTPLLLSSARKKIRREPVSLR